MQVPYCVPYAEHRGEWRLDIPWNSAPEEPHQYWESSDDEECRYRVSTEADFITCFRDKRLAFIGDSTARNLAMQLADFLGQCGSGISAQRLGPDDPLSIRMCGETFAALRAHGDVTVVTPPLLGNVTLAFKWAPYMADVTRVAREALGTPPSSGGVDGAIVTLGLWTAKDAAGAGGMGSAPVKQFLEELPRLAAVVRDELSPRNPSLLAGHLVYGFAPYAEGREHNGGSHPRDVVDALNQGAAAALGSENGGLNIPVFDGQWFTRVSPEALAASNGKIVTWDGYHPAHAVVLTLMREHLSHFCSLPEWTADQSAVPGAPASGAAARGHLLADPHGGASACSNFDAFAIPLLIIFLGTIAIYRILHLVKA